MKKIALKITIILSAFFIFAGVSYARWTDEVDIFVNATTGETDLKISSSSVISGKAEKVTLKYSKNAESIKIIDIDKQEVKISINFKNSGTIPVDVDGIKISGFDLIKGSKSNSKDIDVYVEMFLKGNREIYKKIDFANLGGYKKSTIISPNRTIRLEPGQDATIYVTLSLDEKWNNGRDVRGKDNHWEKDEKISIDFDLEIIYSRFNE